MSLLKARNHAFLGPWSFRIAILVTSSSKIVASLAIPRTAVIPSVWAFSISWFECFLMKFSGCLAMAEHDACDGGIGNHQSYGQPLLPCTHAPVMPASRARLESSPIAVGHPSTCTVRACEHTNHDDILNECFGLVWSWPSFAFDTRVGNTTTHCNASRD